VQCVWCIQSSLCQITLASCFSLSAANGSSRENLVNNFEFPRCLKLSRQSRTENHSTWYQLTVFDVVNWAPKIALFRCRRTTQRSIGHCTVLLCLLLSSGLVPEQKSEVAQERTLPGGPNRRRPTTGRQQRQRRHVPTGNGSKM